MLKSPQRPRLCHVITTPLDRMGPGFRTRGEARIAHEIGFEVEVVTGQTADTENLMMPPPPGVAYYRLPSLTKYIYPQQDGRAILDLCRLFRRKKIQVVHTHLAKAGILGRLAAGLAGVKLVVHSVHGPSFAPSQPYPKQQLYIFLERLAGYFTTHYIFFARHLQESFTSQGIGPKAKKTVIYPGIDFSAFHATPLIPEAEKRRLRATWGLKPDDLVVGYVARMVPAKGQRLAIAACHGLAQRYPKLKLVLVGGAMWPEEKRYLQAMQSMAKDLGLEDRVIFTGHQSEVAPLYRMFDAYLFPSFYESIGLSKLEAYLSGLPVVAFDIPGSREIGPEDATLVPCFSVPALSEALSKVLDNLANFKGDTLQKQTSSAEILRRWSLEKWRDNIKGFYEELNRSLSLRR